ncbi:response regulator [Candidatus Nitrospira bockiana]
MAPRFLVVDDDPATLLAYRALFFVHCPTWAVTAVSTAEEAFGHLRESSFDVVITDLYLPGLDGWSLLLASRVMRWPHRVIMVSAYGSPVLEEKAAQLGAYAFLHKPVAPDTLLALVEQALRLGDPLSGSSAPRLLPAD